MRRKLYFDRPSPPAPPRPPCRQEGADPLANGALIVAGVLVLVGGGAIVVGLIFEFFKAISV